MTFTVQDSRIHGSLPWLILVCLNVALIRKFESTERILSPSSNPTEDDPTGRALPQQLLASGSAQPEGEVNRKGLDALAPSHRFSQLGQSGQSCTPGVTLIPGCPVTHAGLPDQRAALGIDFGHDVPCMHGVSMAARPPHEFGAQWTCVSSVRISSPNIPPDQQFGISLFNDRPSLPTRARLA